MHEAAHRQARDTSRPVSSPRVHDRDGLRAARARPAFTQQRRSRVRGVATPATDMNRFDATT
jgi:hypothetical protein